MVCQALKGRGDMVRRYRRVLALLLMTAVIITSFSINIGDTKEETKAAVKDIKISDEAVNIGLGDQGVEQVLISNMKDSAKYSYKSSDKSVVKVDSQDILTGVSYGTATITINETYKGKTTAAGSYKVTVKETTLKNDAKAADFLWAEIGKTTFKENPFNLQDYVEENLFDCRNMDAVYTFYSGDKNILKIKANGLVEETLKAGKVKITVKETYNKKTRTVGKIGMEVKNPEFTKVDKTVNVAKYSSLDMNKYLKYLTYYYVVLSNKKGNEDEILQMTYTKGEWNGKFKAATCGAVNVTVYTDTEPLDSKTYKKKKCLGSMKVNVVNKAATSVKLVKGDINGKYTEEDSLSISKNKGDSVSVNYIITPKNCSDDISVKSSSSKVVKVVKNDYSYGKGTGVITLKMNGEGKAVIKLTVGSITKKINVTVKNPDAVKK